MRGEGVLRRLRWGCCMAGMASRPAPLSCWQTAHCCPACCTHMCLALMRPYLPRPHLACTCRLYRTVYDKPNFDAKVAAVASMDAICPPGQALPAPGQCCASQDAVLEAFSLLTDAFELIRFNNPTAEEQGLNAVTYLQALQTVAAGGAPRDGARRAGLCRPSVWGREERRRRRRWLRLPACACVARAGIRMPPPCRACCACCPPSSALQPSGCI